MRRVIASKNAPATVGPYSQAIAHDARYRLSLSGQIGINPQDGKLVSGGVQAEAEQALRNIGAVLAEAGWDFRNVVKARVYLTDIRDYGAMNEVYARHFPQNPPARVALAVRQLPLGALVEIECDAAGDTL